MAQELNERSFLGVGWSFPPEWDVSLGRVLMVKEDEDIAESLHLILSTVPGERTMFPRFGCGIHKTVFDEMTMTMITELKDIIFRAIQDFEPRVKVNFINLDDIKQLDGQINIIIDYTIRKTNSRMNMVYPFYIREGTAVDRILFNPEISS